MRNYIKWAKKILCTNLKGVKFFLVLYKIENFKRTWTQKLAKVYKFEVGGGLWSRKLQTPITQKLEKIHEKLNKTSKKN